jgi:hypothetical protein
MVELELTEKEVEEKLSKLSKDFNVEKPDVEFRDLIERMDKGAYDRAKKDLIFISYSPNDLFFFFSLFYTRRSHLWF